MTQQLVLPDDRMPEAEVALRLAEFLSEQAGFGGHVEVAVDGAQVRVGGTDVFDIVGYLAQQGWTVDRPSTPSRNAWATFYRRGAATLEVHSRSGRGDVVATIFGRRVIAECKKGPLVKRPGNPEYQRLKEALGQALLVDAGPDDVVAAVVPENPTFRRIASDWRNRPAVLRSGIQIALVARDGQVSGLHLPTAD
jgi:hypothetical protein